MNPNNPNIVAIYTYYEGEYDIETEAETWFQKIKRIIKSLVQSVPTFKVI